jgi:hypothetical protein
MIPPVVDLIAASAVVIRRLFLTPVCVLLAALSAQAQVAVTPTDGLVSWWRGDENANDSADSNDGTLLNGGAYAPGVFGSAFSLDGINDHVRVANSANLQFTTALTLAAWVNPSSRGTVDNIISKWDAVSVNQRSYGLGIGTDGRGFMALSRTGFGTDASLYTTLATPLNTWTHLAATYDGAFVRFYVNGVFDSELAYSGTIFNGTDDISIGALVGGVGVGASAYCFGGLIDEAVVYNRALTSGEILALATIPEPATAGLFLLGLAGFLLKRRSLRA